MSIRTIVQNAARQIGLPVPATAIDNADENVAQLVRLANQEGLELALVHDWQVLQREQTFTAVAAETQTGALPSDFGRFINGTFYNRSQRRCVVGPMTPQEWQDHKSRSSSVVRDAFRQRGNAILIMPDPTAGDVMAFEYVSKLWVDTDGDGGGDAVGFMADDDTALFSEELMTLGVVWRYAAARGFDYGEVFRSYEAMLARLKGDDGGKRIMDLGSTSMRFGVVTPEGDWNV